MKEQEPNPFEAPNASSEKHGGTRRILSLLATACVAVVIGSYISAELLHLHFPDQGRSMDVVFANSIAALLSSPLSMSLGIFPTLGFYGSHGFLVIPGALMAIVGSALYLRVGNTSALLLVLVGFVLWSHNNLLSFQAMMSA